MGIRSFIVPEEGGFGLYVDGHAHDEAASQLLAYDVENRNTKHKVASRNLIAPRIEAAMLFWMVLLFFFAAQRNHAFSIDWVRLGAAQATLMMEGQWWRAVTALTLHTDSAHLLANLAFGTVFSLLLAQLTGSGLAWATMIGAGTLGNVVNAIVQPGSHTSIGASTALFAGVGLLAALRQSDYAKARRSLLSLRRWAPLAGGVMLLAFLGFSGERTDFLAHVLGFAMGLVAGWLLGGHERNWAGDIVFQLKCGAGAAGAIMMAWLIAVFVSH